MFSGCTVYDLVMGQTVDNTLFNYLVFACGSRELARGPTGQIVDRNTGLSQETIAWLSGKPIRRSTGLSTESLLVRVDELIGEIMLATLSASKCTEQFRQIDCLS